MKIKNGSNYHPEFARGVMFFSALSLSLRDWQNSTNKKLQIDGINFFQWSFIFQYLYRLEESLFIKNHHIFILESPEEVEKFTEYFDPNLSISVYPGLEHGPYGQVFSSEKDLFQRFDVLDKLAVSKKPQIIFTTLDALLLKGPPVHFFKQNHFMIKKKLVLSPYTLAKQLIGIGYQSLHNADEPGSFCHKGEIFDIYALSGIAFRLHYFDDEIEEIFEIDLTSFRTIREKPVEEIHLCASPSHLLSPSYVSTLRNNLSIPQPRFKERFDKRKKIFDHLAQNQLFEDYPAYIPLFFNDSMCLLDFLSNNVCFHFVHPEMQKFAFRQMIDGQQSFFQEEIHRTDSELILPEISRFYDSDLENRLENLMQILIENTHDESATHQKINTLDLKTYLLTQSQDRNFHLNNQAIIQGLIHTLKDRGRLVLVYHNQNSLKELEHIVKIFELKNIFGKRLEFLNNSLKNGFYYNDENTFFLADNDLFTHKERKVKKTKEKNFDLFAEQLSTIKPGDFIIHRDHGIGKYMGVESIEINGKKSDYLSILYQDNDKIFVPVYKINLIQKYADASSQSSIANLKSNKFESAKNKAAQSVKKLAFDLLELHAERKSKSAPALDFKQEELHDFELKFPFEETRDQLKAIDDVISDMQRSTPMERLICGDVGFGKTEVAMRAAFMAVLNKKQVVILVPTTVLASQHYNSFVRRFKDFAVRIEFLSRFKSAAESKQIISDLEKGSIDIIIATHKILGESIKFQDLGLLIIDEEHRFGVGHKEKLKLFKNSLHSLTMSATPIPRTLQLSFLGIRDFSIIQTPPPRRQAIKTLVVKNENDILKQAIDKELQRGGQVFFVHNRVNDIEEISHNIRQISPAAKIVTCHGQMNEKTLEERMNAFCRGDYNVLVCTTIVESGIDIPNANTMIINRADTFGLAQLHQLRGRIGRSERKSYAYLVVDQRKILSDIAQKRLSTLQNFSDLGAGFSIASVDLEIRGTGDILGAEQSGHINSIGLELYLELLNDAMKNLKGEEQRPSINIEIQTHFDAFIPSTYVENMAQRLKYYKMLSNAKDATALIKIQDEITDLFGPAPKELTSLINILELRNILSPLGIEYVNVQKHTVFIRFNKGFLSKNTRLKDSVVDFFISEPQKYKLNPNYSVDCHFNEEINQTQLIEFSKFIAHKIVP